MNDIERGIQTQTSDLEDERVEAVGIELLQT
jgi:hypothetical protein